MKQLLTPPGGAFAVQEPRLFEPQSIEVPTD
jgi:hypothetical protein